MLKIIYYSVRGKPTVKGYQRVIMLYLVHRKGGWFSITLFQTLLKPGIFCFQTLNLGHHNAILTKMSSL